jgi:hypothetical protein
VSDDTVSARTLVIQLPPMTIEQVDLVLAVVDLMQSAFWDAYANLPLGPTLEHCDDHDPLDPLDPSNIPF